QDAVAGEVPCATVGRGHGEAALVELSLFVLLRHERASCLRRKDVLVARSLCEQGSEAPLRGAEAVMRRGVEQPHAAEPRLIDCGAGLSVGGDPAEVAELCATQTETREGRTGAQRAGAHQRPSHPPSTGSTTPWT